jgi:DNA-binding GntR family transcriptional regulator
MDGAAISAPKTLVEAAYQWLRRRILDGTFAPDEKLRVEHLREASRIGATPLREALSRLAAERLVRAEGQRGFRVAPMSLAELEDVTENRVLLEARAVELSVKQGDLAWEAALLAAHHLVARADKGLRGKGASIEDRERHNAAFHDALVAACGSPWLLELRAILFDQHSRYRALALSLIQRRAEGRDIEREHQEIVDAALARQHRRAAAAVEAHIRATATMLRGRLAELLA